MIKYMKKTGVGSVQKHNTEPFEEALTRLSNKEYRLCSVATAVFFDH